MKLVLFDFDKTLTTKDSFIEFLKFTTPKTQLIVKSIFLLPWLCFYKLGFYSGDKFKQKVLKTFFNGWKKTKLTILGEAFSKQLISKILNKEIVLKMEGHLKSGDKVVLVSASLAIWLKPWAQEQNIDLICTKLSFEKEIFRGDFEGENCKGEEKKIQILKQYDLESYSEIICYGNKGDDDQMFMLATSDKNRNFA